MAAKHAFEIFSNDLKNGRLGSLVFLHGAEQYLVSWACDSIVGKIVNEASRPLDLTRFDPGNFDIDAVIEACSTLPIMSPKKVVVLDNFFYIWGGARKDVFGDTQKKSFTELIKNIPDSTLLVVTAPQPDDYRTRRYGNSLSKALAAAGKEYNFQPLQGGQLLGFMKKRLVAAGKSASRDTMEMLIAESGYANDEIDYGLYNLDNDLKKIIALSKGDVVTEEDVAQAVSDNLEHNSFKLMDSICGGRKGDAFNLLRQLLLSGHNEFQLLGMIIGQLELMLETKQMMRLGMSRPQMTKILGVNDYRVRKAMGFSGGYTEKQLRLMLMRAFEVEKNIKRRILGAQMALELFIARI
ncbi:MAG: DNA polymerase III subunit delta [Anaerovoracaceae bacterium]|jgi:DNA polymerase-3 subunit delta